MAHSLLWPDLNWIVHVTYMQCDLRVLAHACERTGYGEWFVRMKQSEYAAVGHVVLAEVHCEGDFACVSSLYLHPEIVTREI